MNYINKKIEDQVGIITLNDSKHLNSLSSKLLNEILDALESFKNNCRVVIIRSEKGSKVFSAGFNIKELPTDAKDPLTYWNPLRKTIRAIQEFTVPVIAMIEGAVWGGGLELVMSCDILIAAESSTFAITPANIGIPYDLTGILNITRNISIPIIKELLFTGNPITASKAKEIGMLNHISPAGELEKTTMKIVNKIKQNAPLVISVLKAEIKLLSSSTAIPPESYEKIQAGRREIYNSEDYLEGINSFIEKRKPVFKGK